MKFINKHYQTVLISLILLIGSAQSYSSETNHSFSFAQMYHWNIPSAKYYRDSLNIQYGAKLAPQHTFEVGLNTGFIGALPLHLIVSYNYNFTRESAWAPGINISFLTGGFGYFTKMGFTDYYPSSGLLIDFRLERSLLKKVSTLLILGLSHELINLSKPQKLSEIDINFYIGIGLKCYLL